jgi:hypothetical protein
MSYASALSAKPIFPPHISFWMCPIKLEYRDDVMALMTVASSEEDARQRLVIRFSDPTVKNVCDVSGPFTCTLSMVKEVDSIRQELLEKLKTAKLRKLDGDVVYITALDG